MPRCFCQCQREAEEQRKAAEERQRHGRIKRQAQGRKTAICTTTPLPTTTAKSPDKARAYVERLEEAYRNCWPALLFRITELASPFSPVVSPTPCLTWDIAGADDELSHHHELRSDGNVFSRQGRHYPPAFDEYDLLIIDDLGVGLQYRVCDGADVFVIDGRYRSHGSP